MIGVLDQREEFLSKLSFNLQNYALIPTFANHFFATQRDNMKWILRLPNMLPTVTCVIVILYLTLAQKPLPDNDLGEIPGLDKLVHAIMFGGLALCIIVDTWRRRALNKHDFATLPSKKLLVWSAIIASLFGAAIEITQQAMGNGRSADIFDLIADIAGACIAALIARWFVKRFLNKPGKA